MWIRAALWEGCVRSGEAALFRSLLEGEMLPALRDLPAVRHVQILWPDSFEGRAPDIICQILVHYDDEAGMRRMLASPGRAALRARLPELAALVEGGLSHVNFHVA